MCVEHWKGGASGQPIAANEATPPPLMQEQMGFYGSGTLETTLKHLCSRHPQIRFLCQLHYKVVVQSQAQIEESMNCL